MVALVDCNNFFVSCERVFRPDLEGKPVVVLSNNDGCVVSRSNESKAMGIKMGTPFFRIKSLADSGVLTVFSSNYILYGDISHRVMSILSAAVPKVEIYSIDEAYLILDGLDERQIHGLVSGLVGKIRKWTGIPVSIGVAPTKTLAKIASHFAKKYPGYKSICFIDSEEKRRKALKLTPISDVWGIGRKLSPKMEAAGIKTAADYCERPEKWVGDHFKLGGLRTWLELHGQSAVEEDHSPNRKSICTSRSFADMVGDIDELSLRVADFAASCAEKLRSEGTAARNVTTFLYTNRFREDLDQYFPSVLQRLPMATDSTQEIVSAAVKGLRLVYRSGYQYKKAGVIVDDIVPADTIQASLFDTDIELRAKNKKISRIMDKLNTGAGAAKLTLASQRSGHYADGVRSDYRSPRYSTSWDELMEVKLRELF